MHYDVTMWRFRVTIVTMETQQFIACVWVLEQHINVKILSAAQQCLCRWRQ